MIWRFWGPLVSGSGPPVIQSPQLRMTMTSRGWAFVASVDGHVLEFAGAGQDLLGTAEAAGVAVDDGVLAALDPEFVGALARV